MNSQYFIDLAIAAVVAYFNDQTDSTDRKITEKDVYVVWACKTLQNNKAILTPSVSDGAIYEVTWNGDKMEAYLDAYKKQKNIVIRSDDFSET